MAKDYDILDGKGRKLFSVNARDTKHAKQLAKRRGAGKVTVVVAEEKERGIDGPAQQACT